MSGSPQRAIIGAIDTPPRAFWSRDCYDGAWCGRQFVLMIGIGY